MNDSKDFSYGIPEEKPRDLGNTIGFFKKVQSNKRPVRVTTANEMVFNMFVTGFDIKGKRIYLGPEFLNSIESRVIVPVEFIISAEQILIDDVEATYKGRLTIKRGDLEDEGYKRSGRDFFQVIRYAHQQGKPIRVYLSDNRVIEGVSTGMNEQSVGIRLPEGKRIQIFYDWVDRITPL